MVALVARDPGLEEGIESGHGEDDARDDDRGDEDVPRDGEAEEHRLDIGEDPQGTVEPSDVPVRLGASTHLVGRVGPEDPDRVDGDEASDECRDAEDDEKEATGLGHVDRHERVADDVVVGAARPGELRVLLGPHHHQVDSHERQDETGDEQDMHAVEAGDELRARELAVEEQEGTPRADDRDRLDDAAGDLQAGA